MATNKCVPWKDGNYKLSTMNNNIFVVNGEDVKMETLQGPLDSEFSLGTWKFGDFEEAHPEVAKETGKKNNNVEISMWGDMWVTKGVVSDDGTNITIMSMTNEVGKFEWMSEEEFIAFKNSGDPHDAPPSHFKIQPEKKGKLLFLSGAPGLGKSTSGLILSRTKDYVYYEADAYGMNVNPYLPPDVEEPSLATAKQKPLAGVPQERIDAINNGIKDFMAMIKGEDYRKEGVENFYSGMCKDIKKERKRMGGDWAVAQAVPSRAFRDHIKKELDNDVIFVVLHMSREDQMKRVAKRHGDSQSTIVDWLKKLYDLYEPAAEDEENAIGIDVTNDMSREEVVQRILDSLP